MTIHVTIGEAEKRLAELVDAAVRGEDVVLSGLGGRQVKLAPVATSIVRTPEQLAERLARRQSMLGIFAKEFEGFDTSLAALKADRPDPDEKFRDLLGAPD